MPKSLSKFLKKHILIIILVLFLANSSVAYMIYSKAQSQNCLSQQQIDSDPRCLYVYQNNVYQMGTRQDPHKGNPCGITVDSIIPGFHFAGEFLVKFSNTKVAPLCTGGNPTSAPTQMPTAQPTQQPTANPTQSGVPTQQPAATSGGIGGFGQTPIPTSAPTLNPTQPAQTPTEAPAQQSISIETQIPEDRNRFTTTQQPIITTESNTSKPVVTKLKKPDYTKITKPLAYVSLIIFLVSLVVLLF